MKVNPVTGKMEKIDPNEKLPEGKHRDGCLLVDDRYVNAAKDLGLGGANGALWGGGCFLPAEGGAVFRPPLPPARAARAFTPTPPSPRPHLLLRQACTAT